MAIVSGPPWALSEDDMVNLLADFHCWLTNPFAIDRAGLPSIEAADRFLTDNQRDHTGIVHRDAHRYCDLCGLAIPPGGSIGTEGWTGDYLSFCLPCYEHQAAIVRRIGLIAYRKRWCEQRESEVGLG